MLSALVTRSVSLGFTAELEGWEEEEHGVEGASLGRAEWDIPRGTEQMVKDQPLPI